jgi:ankyrin repeat protein
MDNINHADRIGWTALTAASRNGHDKIVDLLIKNKANINHADNNGITALIYASYYGYSVHVIETLIEKKADLFKQLTRDDNFYTEGKKGDTALDVAKKGLEKKKNNKKK